MRGLGSVGALMLAGALLAGPVLAQQTSPNAPAPDTGQPAATPAPTTPEQPAPPAPATETPAGAPAARSAPNLVVATVKLTSGRRASRLIGSSVYNDQNQQIGSIDDLIVMPDNRISLAIISVGGFLGMGSKLVAVPFDHMQFETGKDHAGRVVLTGASKASLQAMPSFTYGNG